MKSIRLEVDQDRARALGLTPQDVAADAADAALGLHRHAVSRRHRAHRRGRPRGSGRASRARPATGADHHPRNGVAVPLSQVARLNYEYEEPILWRRNRDMVLTVRGDIVDDVQAPDVTKEIEPSCKHQGRASLRLPYRDRRLDRGERQGECRAVRGVPGHGDRDAGDPDDPAAEFLAAGLGVHDRAAGLIGATGALLVSNRPFGFVALLGLIALAGMIMRNTVILVDQIDRDIAAGHGRHRAIIDATVRRARPVVLTALAAILGMIPLAGSVFWGPMAITIMGGLFVATALTLLVVPALYALWFRVRRDETIDAPAFHPQWVESFERDLEPIRIAAE